MNELHNRISTGSAQADEILHGGFPTNSINIIMGQPGTGKTIFAEQMAFHNADGTRPILYLATLSELELRKSNLRIQIPGSKNSA